MKILISLYYDKRVRSWGFQISFLIILFLFIGFLINNVHTNLTNRNISTGFSFLNKEAGFEIGESLISYIAEDTYLKALLVGLINTMKVSIVGSVLAVSIGLLVALASIFENLTLKIIARSYIEFLRNIPLLLQLLLWYSILTGYLPSVKNAINIKGHIFLSNRGLNFTAFDFSKMSFERPVLVGFNFENGINLSPEFMALLLGLVLYTSAFIAEIFRSGILSVSKGQWEAATSLGLNKLQVFFYIIFPQGLKVIIPPLISQLLNLVKNSSLAVAIGYPDFVSVANTSMNQTGQAIELITLIMIVYLSLSLLISYLMNWYNLKIIWAK